MAGLLFEQIVSAVVEVVVLKQLLRRLLPRLKKTTKETRRISPTHQIVSLFLCCFLQVAGYFGRHLKCTSAESPSRDRDNVDQRVKSTRRKRRKTRKDESR